MSVSKFVDMTYSSASRFIKRYFQTVRSIEPKTTPEIVQGIPFENLSLPTIRKSKYQVFEKEVRVQDILEKVQSEDGLPLCPSHIEHLVGRATKGKIYQNHAISKEARVCSSTSSGVEQDVFVNFESNQEKYEVGGIDIANKTQLILQSPHPVRYVIDRQLRNSQKGLSQRLPSYHTWIFLFGRSLIPHFQARRENHDELLNYISSASDSGMFSADIHHTIMDIPSEHPSFSQNVSQFHMGNKYAVLVGDYFAIRCIYYAEKTKTNSVMVAITEGVEEFTTCTFSTNLFDKTVGYPLILSSSASVYDWVKYNQKAFGYLKGGLNAVWSLQSKRGSREGGSPLDKQMEKFVANLIVFLKASLELESLNYNDSIVPSPFVLSSLPAILCQMENPGVFLNLRKSQYELNSDHIKELHDIIRKSSAPKRTRKLISSFGDETKASLRRVAKNEYYIHVLDSLIDAVTEGI